MLLDLLADVPSAEGLTDAMTDVFDMVFTQETPVQENDSVGQPSENADWPDDD